MTQIQFSSDHNIEPDSNRLERLLTNDMLSLDLVSAFSGDRQLTSSEFFLFTKLQNRLGNKFYSDLLYTISHQFFEPIIARGLWDNILKHKIRMSNAMKRNIRIAVAALDYLSNLTNNIRGTTLINEEHIAEIVRGSLHDWLTGLFNHAYCYQTIESELKRYARYGTDVSLIMLDIDDFKKVNDQYGHLEGDKILTSIGVIIQGEARDCDICCRYGGEEFVIILPSTKIYEAAQLAERIREKVENSKPNNRKITVSVGVTTCGESNLTSYTIIKKADVAMYQAKSLGKNRVLVRE